ncbi:snare-like protein [Rozella allomycis CSF55]|uniref:Protein transport protein SEC22 n=1 Tax=Rozella allomycis (strain CSF55) TaxID=988480 RepID=A0A075AYX3_ROZAC|nr:Longin domain-containing protein [Rozella allomycis CSF55]RKP20290.1 snare-like protein [Rozella allomycis CSF55]|eukprot:EPZ33749.1 Longin domain-containing protein [Rozella allomycis CSF55]
MVRSTIIARVADGLPLAASLDDDEQEFSIHKQQAKALLKRLTESTDQRCSVETGPYVFHYLIELNVCYLCICDRSYPKKLAFSYLEELQKEFQQSFADRIETVDRPYALIKFDTYIQKAKRNYQDARSQRNVEKLNEDLQDVTRIMTKNIQDVLGRGERIDKMTEISSKLSEESKKYAKEARNLNLMAMYRKYGPPAIVVFIVLVVLYLYSKF